MNEEQIEDLKKRVDHIEYGDIKDIKEDMAQMKVDMATNNLLTKQSVETTAKLSDTLDMVKTTMVELTQTINKGNEATNKLSEKVGGLEIKLDNLEDSQKFNIMEFIKSNFISIIIGVGIISYLFLK